MPRQPNILVILSDQHAPDVMACAGDPVVRTPNLDALAARGVRFDNAYCAAPICVPSRMTMLTGRHCSDIGVWSNHGYLGSDIPTFAHALGAAGAGGPAAALCHPRHQGCAYGSEHPAQCVRRTRRSAWWWAVADVRQRKEVMTYVDIHQVRIL